jgi:hypothetical protein
MGAPRMVRVRVAFLNTNSVPQHQFRKVGHSSTTTRFHGIFRRLRRSDLQPAGQGQWNQKEFNASDKWE